MKRPAVRSHKVSLLSEFFLQELLGYQGQKYSAEQFRESKRMWTG
jgi:hypothetical protein